MRRHASEQASEQPIHTFLVHSPIHDPRIAIIASDQPKVIELAPPGGARTRVVGRPVMKFPEFWLDPVAYAFAETTAAAGAATASGTAGGFTSPTPSSSSPSSSTVGTGGSSIMGIGAGPSGSSRDSGVVGCVGVGTNAVGDAADFLEGVL